MPQSRSPAPLPSPGSPHTEGGDQTRVQMMKERKPGKEKHTHRGKDSTDRRHRSSCRNSSTARCWPRSKLLARQGSEIQVHTFPLLRKFRIGSFAQTQNSIGDPNNSLKTFPNALGTFFAQLELLTNLLLCVVTLKNRAEFSCPKTSGISQEQWRRKGCQANTCEVNASLSFLPR